jgi:hypothetical protein
VTHLLRETGERLWRLLGEEGAHLYVCGDAKMMAKDVRNIVKEICQVRNQSWVLVPEPHSIPLRNTAFDSASGSESLFRTRIQSRNFRGKALPKDAYCLKNGYIDLNFINKKYWYRYLLFFI